MEAIKFDAIELEIYDRLEWFIKLRWAAIASMAGITLAFKYLFGIELFSIALFSIFTAMILYNILCHSLNKKLHTWQFRIDQPVKIPIRFANFQIGLDLIFLALLWQMYGGVENPIMFFFVFHMIIAAILLSRKICYLWAIFSTFLIILIAGLEYTEIIKHNHVLSRLTGIILWDNLPWIFFTLSTFCFTLICVVFMTSTITSRLHNRNKELVKLTKEISDKKLHATEKQLHVSEKMASLGKLAAGIAHEINNPLTTILSFSECLADDLEDRESSLDDINVIIKETIRIREIVKDILNFARVSETSGSTDTNVNDDINETVNMLKNQMNFIDVTFDIKLQDGLPEIKIDKEHLKQVFINLILNASQAMAGKGEISIETFFNNYEKQILIKFSDTGPGVSPGNLNKIFDPYFTTKKHGQGTGLGLAVSYGIIGMYNGEITVESEPGEGATFIIILPLLQEQV